MKLFSVDQHISVVADLKQIWSTMGHSVADVCLSGHAPVMGRRKDSVPMLDGDSWCGFDERKDWNRWYMTYGNKLKHFDAFVACYPPIWAMLYKRFDKPVIIDIPIRYEYGTNTVERWQAFNEYLLAGQTTNMVHLVANSRYDKEYTETFLGVRCVEHIPSLCAYTGAQYLPVDNRVLYYSTAPIADLGPVYARKHDTLAFGHSWQDVAGFRCIVHFPYNVSTMSIFEQYTSNIPLLFPTRDFLVDLYAHGYPVLEQMSWNSTYRKPPGSILKPECQYDPNDYSNLESVKYWLQFADFYNTEWMQNIIYFSSFEELNYLVDHVDFAKVSNAMRTENETRSKRVHEKWRFVIGKVELCLQ